MRCRVVDRRWGVDRPFRWAVGAVGAVVEGLVERGSGEAAAVEGTAVDGPFDLDGLEAVGSDGGSDLFTGPGPVQTGERGGEAFGEVVPPNLLFTGRPHRRKMVQDAGGAGVGV